MSADVFISGMHVTVLLTISLSTCILSSISVKRSRWACVKGRRPQGVCMQEKCIYVTSQQGIRQLPPAPLYHHKGQQTTAEEDGEASGEQLQPAILDDVLPFQSCGILDSCSANAKSTLTSNALNCTWRAHHGHRCGQTPASILVSKAEVARRKQPKSCRGTACRSMCWFPTGYPQCKTHLCLAFLSAHNGDCMALHICRGKLNKFLELPVLRSKTRSMLILI